MTRTTNQPHNSFFSTTLKATALLGVVLGSTQFTSQASAQDSPCPEPQFDPSSLNPAPDMWIAHVRINTENSAGPHIRDGSGFIVSPHALLLPASMLYQRSALPNPGPLPVNQWIGGKSEYTITPNAQTVADTEHSYTILAPYGTRTPSRRLISRDFITTSNSWAARVRYNWGALQFDCPFEGLDTGMAVTFSKDALNHGTATIGGYKKLEPWIWTKYSFEQAKHHLDASDLKYSYSKLNMKV